MKTPCEVSMWYVVPYIRSQLAISMVKDLNLRQAEAARRLDVTDAAISQYLSGKRAHTKIDDKKVSAEIRRAAVEIVEDDTGELLKSEICRLCKLISQKGLTDQIAGGECANCP